MLNSKVLKRKFSFYIAIVFLFASATIATTIKLIKNTPYKGAFFIIFLAVFRMRFIIP